MQKKKKYISELVTQEEYILKVIPAKPLRASEHTF